MLQTIVFFIVVLFILSIFVYAIDTDTQLKKERELEKEKEKEKEREKELRESRFSEIKENLIGKEFIFSKHFIESNSDGHMSPGSKSSDFKLSCVNIELVYHGIEGFSIVGEFSASENIRQAYRHIRRDCNIIKIEISKRKYVPFPAGYEAGSFGFKSSLEDCFSRGPGFLESEEYDRLCDEFSEERIIRSLNGQFDIDSSEREIAIAIGDPTTKDRGDFEEAHVYWTKSLSILPDGRHYSLVDSGSSRVSLIFSDGILQEIKESPLR